MTTPPASSIPLPPGTTEQTSDGLTVRRVPAGTRWHRIHAAERGALYFGGPDPNRRFNDPGPGPGTARRPAPHPDAAPDAGAYGVCYLGVTPEAAFVETFFRRLPSVAVAQSELAARRITRVRLEREVRLVCLHGEGLIQARVDGSVVAGDADDYALSQAVARLLWRHPAGFDGIEYPARHDTHQFSVGLFDRARAAVAVEATERLDDPARLRGWLRRYRFALL